MSRLDDVGRQSLQLLDECEPQHDRDGPDLADRERRAALKRGGKADERLQIEAAGGVDHQLAGQDIHTRVTVEGTTGELGQLEIVLARQILFDRADLILDDVKVVAQPVFRADRSGVRVRRRGQRVVRVLEDLGALVEARASGLRATGSGASVCVWRESFGMRFELFLTEQFGSRSAVSSRGSECEYGSSA